MTWELLKFDVQYLFYQVHMTVRVSFRASEYQMDIVRVAKWAQVEVQRNWEKLWVAASRDENCIPSSAYFLNKNV
jgi:hypothetical protein